MEGQADHFSPHKAASGSATCLVTGLNFLGFVHKIIQWSWAVVARDDLTWPHHLLLPQVW